VSCKLQRFILYTSLDTSAWILIAVTVERFLAVCMPQHHHFLKTPRHAFRAVGGIVLFQSAFNLHVFWTRGRQVIVAVEDNSTVIINCAYPTESARNYWTFYQSWVSMLVYCVVPFCVMLILNIFIIRTLRKHKRSMARKRSLSANSRKATKGGIPTDSMTRMLLCVTLYFIIVTTPSFIFTMIQDVLFYKDVVTAHQHAVMELVDGALTVLLYLNHSINFLLYCLTGRRFRSELIMMCRRTKTTEKQKYVLDQTLDPMIESSHSVEKQQE